MSNSITDFLLARIAEDEAVARDLLSEAALFADGSIEWGSRMAVHYPGGGRATVLRSALTTPARVLAECEAKRRIVEEHPQFVDPHQEPVPSYCETCERATSPCLTLRALALPYADHPDYRDEWRV